MESNNFIDLDSYSIESNSVFREHVEPFKLWFDYLRLSPSYWLAHQYKENELDAEISLPDDFEFVLKTYDDFGSVYDLPFDWWWRSTGERLFAKPYRPRPPVILGRAGEMNEATWLKRRQQLANLDEIHGYKISGGRDYLLIAVPLDGQERKALAKLSSHFAEAGLASYLPTPNKSAYTLACKRFTADALRNNLNVLLTRAEHPEWDLIKISKHVDISITQPDKLEKIHKPRVLESMVCRATNLAWTYAENAARGRFPCKDEVPLLNVDYGELWERICETKRKDQEFMKMCEPNPTQTGLSSE